MKFENVPHQSMLDEAGLNRQFVFNLADLPEKIRTPLQIKDHENQLILFAHTGRTLWTRVQAERGSEANPIDEYSVRTVKTWQIAAIPGARTRFVFPQGLPNGQHVGLQSLGRLAGWHHASPFMLGIDANWGSWFAYRAAIVTDSDIPVSTKVDGVNPCDSCTTRICIRACIGGALKSGTLDFEVCKSERFREGSSCATSCNARQSCHVGNQHMYEKSQIEHGARISLAAIRKYYKPTN